MSKFVCTLATAGVIALAMAASARGEVVLNVINDRLFGAAHVPVLGALYNVEFKDGTCVQLFAGCDEASDFAFTSRDEARAAAQSLLDNVFVEVDYLTFGFDVSPSRTNGCFGTSCDAFIPFELTSQGGLNIARAINETPISPSGIGIDHVDDGVFLPNLTTAPMEMLDEQGNPILVNGLPIMTDFGTYAVFTRQVPEPTSGILLAIGLLAAFGVRLVYRCPGSSSARFRIASLRPPPGLGFSRRERAG